jgi:hypothetical protein
MSSESSVPRQFHLLSFEGPDLYARAGGRRDGVVGLAEALCSSGPAAPHRRIRRILR